MKRRVLSLAFAGLLVACEERVDLDRRLSSFEVILKTPVGLPEARCPLPGTPTSAFDLTGCPIYEHDAQGRTVTRLVFDARAVDNFGALYETYSGIATVGVVPGKVESAFTQVRFTEGVVTNAVVSFRAAFGDTYVWVTDDKPPPRSADVTGLGLECGFDAKPTCAKAGLACVNTKPAVGDDPQGLAYCTTSCSDDTGCPQGFFCSAKIVAYADAAVDVSGGACVRRQPTFAAGSAGPIHLVEPNLADVSRSDSLLSSPFQDDFIEVQRGKMIVTAIRFDGFYVTDVCPLPQSRGGPAADDPACTPEERAIPEEFNHLFVFNFSRPEDLAPGDQLVFVGGPMTEFVGLTEMSFPLWEVNYAVGLQPIPLSTDLHETVSAHFPHLVERGEDCFRQNTPLEKITLFDCDYALERLEGARVSLRVKAADPIVAGSDEEETLERFGQWRATVDTPLTKDKPISIVTRENIPFFDPRKVAGKTINAIITGNLRQVAFEERGEPIWILEPRDETDCAWCKSN